MPMRASATIAVSLLASAAHAGSGDRPSSQQCVVLSSEQLAPLAGAKPITSPASAGK